ncbi:unnamed protein product [Gadus morhua 'NCC']
MWRAVERLDLTGLKPQPAGTTSLKTPASLGLPLRPLEQNTPCSRWSLGLYTRRPGPESFRYERCVVSAIPLSGVLASGPPPRDESEGVGYILGGLEAPVLRPLADLPSS